MLEVSTTAPTSAASLPPVPYLPPEPPSSAHADKLYLVTRSDLSVGYQITQTVHAAADWHAAHPESAATWQQISNSVIVLTVPDEAGLYDLWENARKKGLETTLFREPDLGDELTAIAFTPSEGTRKFLANLPLAGRKLADQEPLLAREKALRDLSYAMMECEQTKGQDVLAHGRSVREHYFALVDHLEGHLDLHQAPNWRLPAWIDDYAEQLADATVPRHIMGTYTTLHDAGKPFCREVGEDGKVRFPGHAETSARTYRETAAAGGFTPDETVADLIAGDMDIHLLKAAGIPEFITRPTVIAHLLTGLAEVTSNAAMFGGVESTSYKIKAKHLDQRGRAICKAMFGEPAVTADQAAQSSTQPSSRSSSRSSSQQPVEQPVGAQR